ncbi:MAG: DNA translocase FtsK 4TM domain-containing protein [Anaerolineaceae bacterium]
MTQAQPKKSKAKKTDAPQVSAVSNGKANHPAKLGESQDFSGRFSRFGWDLTGVLLLSGGMILLLGVLGITRGVMLDTIIHNLSRWFGLGRYVVPLVLMVGGWLLLLWRKNQEEQVPVGRVILSELAMLLLLGAFSAFAQDNVLKIEEGKSLGGSVGWGLAHPLVSVMGWLGAGIVLCVLAFILLVFGLNLLGRLETWARKKAGEPVPVLIPETATATTTPETRLTDTNTPRTATSPSPRLKTQASLPTSFTRNLVTEPVEEKKRAGTAKRSEELPPLTLLDEEKPQVANQATINMNAGILEKTLSEFGIPAKVVGYRVGPTVTQYAVEPGYIEKGGNSEERQKIRISQISALSRDLALALKAERLRIEAPVPGKSYVGVEVPNTVHTIVKLKPILESENFTRVNSPLALPLGRDVSGQPLVSDLATMPHLLIAGTTNSGKSICIAAMTTCLVMNNKPEDLKLVMIDPKMVELNRFNGLPHLLGQVETDVERIMAVLRWAVTEMDYRYKLLESAHARNLDSYNTKMERSGQSKLPRVVIMIDELADLMMSAPEQTEAALVRLAQKSRAVGIHLVVATQRPSTDVVTGIIKANFPTRIAFTVASSVDSRVILDANGAETLLGKGDMLFLHPEIGISQRSQGVLVSDQELERVIRWWQEHTKEAAIKPEPVSTKALPAVEESAPWEDTIKEGVENNGDEALIRQAIELLQKDKRASASYLQRQLRIGYPRAAWLIDQLEARGILGPAQSGGKEREILLDDSENQ